MVNSPLIRPYELGVVALGGYLRFPWHLSAGMKSKFTAQLWSLAIWWTLSECFFLFQSVNSTSLKQNPQHVGNLTTSKRKNCMISNQQINHPGSLIKVRFPCCIRSSVLGTLEAITHSSKRLDSFRFLPETQPSKQPMESENDLFFPKNYCIHFQLPLFEFSGDCRSLSPCESVRQPI